MRDDVLPKGMGSRLSTANTARSIHRKGTAHFQDKRKCMELWAPHKY